MPAFARVARLLRIPAIGARSVELAITFYLFHVLCQGWIGSSQIFLGLAVCMSLIAWRAGELSIAYHPLYLPLILFLAGSCLSAAFAEHPFQSARQISEFFSFLAFPMALSFYRREPRVVRTTLRTFIILATFLSVYGVYQYFFLNQRDLEHRITGTLAHVMTYSGILMPISLFCFVLFLYERRPALLLATIVSSLALVLTFTRGAWLGWLAGFATIVFLRRPRWFLFIVPILILALALGPLSIFARLISSFDLHQSSNLDRVRMAQAGLEIIKDRPLTGVGPSNIKQIYPLYRRADAPRFRIPHLHNNVVQLWAERGILGLAGYVSLIVMFIYLCWRTPRENLEARMFGDGGIAVAVALTVAGVFEFNFGDSEVLLTTLDMFALTCGAIEVGSRGGAAGGQEGELTGS